MKKGSRAIGVFQHHVAPRLEDVKIYFAQKGIPETEARDFFSLYESRHWKDRSGNLIGKWKPRAYRWIQSILRENPLMRQKANR